MERVSYVVHRAAWDWGWESWKRGLDDGPGYLLPHPWPAAAPAGKICKKLWDWEPTERGVTTPVISIPFSWLPLE